MSALVLLFFGPVLVPYLVKLGLKEEFAGYGISICWLMYSAGCPLAGYMYQVVNRKAGMTGSILLCAISIFMVGPSLVLKLPLSVPLIFTGLALLGLGISGIVVPIIPELFESI
jgi:MFS family permease